MVAYKLYGLENDKATYRSNEDRDQPPLFIGPVRPQAPLAKGGRGTAQNSQAPSGAFFYEVMPMGKFTIKGSAAQRGGDSRLVAIMKAAAAQSPYDVEFFSGGRNSGVSGSQHKKNLAVDMVLIDPNTGEKIPNLRAGGAAFEAYQQFANTAREVQKRDFPEMNDQFRWGGYFRQGKPGDLMHFDFKPGAAMAAGSWDGGLNDIGERIYAGFDDPQLLHGEGPQASASLPKSVLGSGARTAVAAIEQIAPTPETRPTGLGLAPSGPQPQAPQAPQLPQREPIGDIARLITASTPAALSSTPRLTGDNSRIQLAPGVPQPAPTPRPPNQ